MTDPVDRAIEQLRSDRWCGSTRHERIEAAIMDATGRPGRRGLVLGIAALLIGSAIVTASVTGVVTGLISAGDAAVTSEPDRPNEHAHEEPTDEFTEHVETANN